MNSHILTPLFSARSRQEFNKHAHNVSLLELGAFEKTYIDNFKGVFNVDGYCIPCGKNVSFRVDMGAGGQQIHGNFVPNWRERLICPGCNMSNRQRLIATLIMQYLESSRSYKHVYTMEQVTPLYKWISAKYGAHTITGSEYIANGIESGRVVGVLEYQAPLRSGNLLISARKKLGLMFAMLKMGGVRHEDVTHLGFPDDSLDLIVSNDVFEHVPDVVAAFRECARTLKIGGYLMATIPFHCDRDNSVVRARLENGVVVHQLDAVYHGNPVSADGSLVFTDFGWDVIHTLVSSGFSEAVMEIYGSKTYGHLGGGQMVLRAIK